MTRLYGPRDIMAPNLYKEERLYAIRVKNDKPRRQHIVETLELVTDGLKKVERASCHAAGLGRLEAAHRLREAIECTKDVLTHLEEAYRVAMTLEMD